MKQEKMKARGIRFTGFLWGVICKQAEKQKVTPSDIIRGAVEAKYTRRG